MGKYGPEKTPYLDTFHAVMSHNTNMENESFNTHESFSTLLRTAVSFELLLYADYYKKIHILLRKLRKTLIEDFQHKDLIETEQKWRKPATIDEIYSVRKV